MSKPLSAKVLEAAERTRAKLRSGDTALSDEELGALQLWRWSKDPAFERGEMSEHDRAIAIVDQVAIEQLREYREELTEGQMKVIADQIAREAVRRLNEMK